ncbi:MAG: hypothetical protein JWQ78_48 [Sediminibacterium sp.]|nr:hypothetical protein [Sediminibacterium sp.]
MIIKKDEAKGFGETQNLYACSICVSQIPGSMN